MDLVDDQDLRAYERQCVQSSMFERVNPPIWIVWRADSVENPREKAAFVGAMRLGKPTSRDTLLRALRRQGSKVTMAPPVVIGIDD